MAQGLPARLSRAATTRQHVLAPCLASAVPRRRAKKWAFYQALGMGTLARLPCPQFPVPHLAFRGQRLRASISVS
jgi:hypothetical protein